MDDSLTRDYLSLSHHRGFSAGSLARILGELGPLSHIRQLPKPQLLAAGVSASKAKALLQPANPRRLGSRLREELDWAKSPGRAIIHFESADYPPLLREIATPPPVLYVEGRLQTLHEPAIAMVGSRRGSAYGRRHAEWLAHALSEAGLTVCSGMALGVDSAAHKGALAAGGFTMAVMGAGVDICYPARNRELREQIRAQGVLVSEFHLGSPPAKPHFPQRNRIISGLCSGVVVIEASLKSGSLVTAKFALQQNREIFALPGPVSSPYSRGSHQLIRQGAKLVETPDDVLQELEGILPLDRFRPRAAQAAQAATDKPGGKSRLDPSDARLIALIEESGSLPETLAGQAGLPLRELSIKLLQLELAGAVHLQGGRYFRS